jgi:hypothetical protein
MPFLATVRCIAKVLAERWHDTLKPHRVGSLGGSRTQIGNEAPVLFDASVLPHSNGTSRSLKIADFDKIERRE